MNHHFLTRTILFKLKNFSNFDLLVLFTILLLLAYTIMRANILSFTHDESLSYLAIHSHDGLLMTANNHILNTIFMKISEYLFGETEWALRLPNVIAHVLFMIMGWRILIALQIQERLGTQQTRVIIICYFLLLNTNPFMLDFFSLARGYGLSLGFLLTSVYFFRRDISEHLVSYKWVFTFLFSSLAVMSNFNMLNYHLSLLIVMIISEFAEYKNTPYLQRLKNIFRNYQILFIINLCFVALVSFWLMFLRQQGELYFGGNDGLIKDSIDSFVKASLYFNNDNREMIRLIRYSILILYAAISGMTLYMAIIHKKVSAALGLFLIVSLNVLIIVVQHYLIKTPYPIERTILFLLPLYFSYFIFFMDELSVHFKRFAIFVAVPLSVVLSFICMLNFFNSINFTKTYTWVYDSQTKIMMQDLQKEYVNMNHKPKSIMLGIDWVFEPTTNYYRLAKRFKWLQPTTRGGYLEKKYDFYYLFENENNKLKANQNISILKQYVRTNTVLSKATGQ